MAAGLSAVILLAAVPAYARTGTAYVTEKEPAAQTTAAAPEDVTALAEESGVSGFVERLYTIVLGRASEPAGKANWVSSLTAKTKDGEGAAYGFFFSDEYTGFQKSDDAFVEDLYKTLLGRSPDSNGKTAWLTALTVGKTRSGVFAGFVNSSEFSQICAGYGIERGTYQSPEVLDQNDAVTGFVYRLYARILKRTPDRGGQADWVSQILTGRLDGAHAAWYFLGSDEFINKKVGDSDFVEILYQVFLDRGADAAGKKTWETKLKLGASRLAVTAGFACSSEYGQLCASYGIGTVDLFADFFQPVPMDQLANLTSLQKRASAEELAQAYAAACGIVRFYADTPLEDQLKAITAELYSWSTVYSMSEAHYNDPYGYFILRVASCAGAARTAGLCLNILGIPYEHVNENQNTHQWCRVNVNGVYWVVDANGGCCQPEPAPYQHPWITY